MITTTAVPTLTDTTEESHSERLVKDPVTGQPILPWVGPVMDAVVDWLETSLPEVGAKREQIVTKAFGGDFQGFGNVGDGEIELNGITTHTHNSDVEKEAAAVVEFAWRDGLRTDVQEWIALSLPFDSAIVTPERLVNRAFEDVPEFVKALAIFEKIEVSGMYVAVFHLTRWPRLRLGSA